ncbi:type II toxin-antitoxin system MqsA family antitoxin [Burkholderia cenocepacia]|uniref:type II toxin-antitoxin system MqsA family antitoxin n=1 Tax=Burkholderia cenocepacia TaxID=95486 RepID=UPI00158AD139|nr:type II toxin-antitoxin system MqsA family antitoxin [Burkholderia cenocepacia]
MKSNLGPCPVCGEGQLHQELFSQEFTENGKTSMIDMRMEVCNLCGAEVAGRESARANRRAVAKFRKQAEGLLTGDEVAAIRRKYGLRQDEAAAIFGGGPVAFSKYEADDVAQSIAMDRALRVCDSFPPALFQYAWIAEKIDVVEDDIERFVSCAAKNIQARGVASHCDIHTIRDIVFETLRTDVWHADEGNVHAESAEPETTSSRVILDEVAIAASWNWNDSGQNVGIFRIEDVVTSTKVLKAA